MSQLTVATDVTFAKEVLAAKGTVLVEFGATWCPPCRALKPVIESLARERAGTLKVVEIDIDASPETSRRFGVRAAPTLVVFRDGKKVVAHVGAMPKDRIAALLEA